jgi:hypothetical protein
VARPGLAENQWPARAAPFIMGDMFRHAVSARPATAGRALTAAPVRAAHLLPGLRR